DVRLLQRRGDLDFAIEPLGADPLRQLGGEDLYDDLAPQLGIFGDEDAGHPAAAQLTLQCVCRTECRLELFAQVHATEGRARESSDWGECGARLKYDRDRTSASVSACPGGAIRGPTSTTVRR